MDKAIELADELTKAAQELTGEADERVAVEKVLKSHLDVGMKNAEFLALLGKAEHAADFDPKAMRGSVHDRD